MTDGAAGFDVSACLSGPVVLKPGARALVSSGFAIAVPDGFEAQVRPRSGLAFRHGITVLNSPGTIDSDYRGELKILLINHGREPFEIRHGERIAQLVVAPVALPEIVEVSGFETTARAEGGFGSTGKS